MYAKSLERWNKVLPKNRKKWAIFRKHMINEYNLKITERGGTKMVQQIEIAMHATDTNTEEDSLTEAVTKYAERATRAEANMAEMEAKFEEQFAILSMTSQQPQTYTHPTHHIIWQTQSPRRQNISQHHPHRSYHHRQLSSSPPHNNRHHIRNTTK